MNTIDLVISVPSIAGLLLLVRLQYEPPQELVPLLVLRYVSFTLGSHVKPAFRSFCGNFYGINPNFDLEELPFSQLQSDV